MRYGLVVGWLLAVPLAIALYFMYGVARAHEAESIRLSAELAAAKAQVHLIQKRVTTANTDAQRARQELHDALRKNPEWAAEPVPDAVRDSLCQRIRCAKPGAMPAPGS